MIRRTMLLIHLKDLSNEIRELVNDKDYDTAITLGERALISAAADNVAAAYRIISTGDPNARP